MQSEISEVRFPYEFSPDEFAYAIVEHCVVKSGRSFFMRYYIAMPALPQIHDNDDVVGNVFRKVENTVIDRYARAVVAREIAEESA